MDIIKDRKNMDFEKTVLYLAKDFINIPLSRTDEAINEALSLVASLYGMDCMCILLIDWDSKTAVIRNKWRRLDSADYDNLKMPLEKFPPQVLEKLSEGSICCSYIASDMHSSNLNSAGIDDFAGKKVTIIPLKKDNIVFGACVFSLSEDKEVPDTVTSITSIFAEMITSVLQRAEYEKEIHEKTISIQLLLDSTNDGIGMTAKDGTIMNVNKAFARRFDKAPEELIGRNFRELLPEQKYGSLFEERKEKICAVYRTHKPFVFEDTRDGMWFLNRSYPVFKNGEVIAAALFSTDITDHVKLQEKEKELVALRVKAQEMKKKEAEYLEILDSSTEGSYVVDFEKNTAKYSENWKKRLGLENVPPEQLLDKFHERMAPEEAEENIRIRYEVQDVKSPKIKRVLKVKDKDDKSMWVMVHGKFVYNDYGKLLKTYGTFFDITELKELELELIRQKNELIEKNKLITEFFINISHEFKTPLSIILMSFDELNSNKNDPCRQRVLSVIQQNTYRLTKLISNLLDATKIESKFETVNYASDDIISIAENLCGLVMGFAAKAGISLKFTSDCKFFVMMVDRDKVERILLNLLSNAIKNTKPGGNIEVRTECISDKVTLLVIDSGIGIPRDMQGIIFDRFRQVNSTLARSSQGCGIGLSLTKGLAELMGGKISVKSEQGKGSIFSVELPVYKTPSEQKSFVSEGLELSKKVNIELSDLS